MFDDSHESETRYIRESKQVHRLTEFARNKFIEGGLPKESLVKKTKFLPSIPTVGRDRGDYCICRQIE